MERERSVADLLNDLLVIERSGLIPRLDEIEPFVGPANLRLMDFPSRAAAESHTRQSRLMRLVIAQGGLPAAAAQRPTDAGAHYLTLEYLRPRLIRELEQRRAAFEQAAAALPKGTLRDTIDAMATQQAESLEELRASAGGSADSSAVANEA